MVNIRNQVKESMFFILCRLDFEYHEDVLGRGGDYHKIRRAWFEQDNALHECSCCSALVRWWTNQHMACKKCDDEVRARVGLYS